MDPVKKLVALIIVAAVLLLPALCQADRSDDLRAEYQQLLQQRRLIEERLLRLEGMFTERQLMGKEAAEIALPAEEAEEAEEEE